MPNSLVCLAACVPSQDIHTPAQTVIEALWFSARLRLPAGTTDDQVGGGGVKGQCRHAKAFCVLCVAINGQVVEIRHVCWGHATGRMVSGEGVAQ